MGLIRDKTMKSSFANRCLILECAFISREEKEENLAYGVEIHENVPEECTNMDFEKLDGAHKILLITDKNELDHYNVTD